MKKETGTPPYPLLVAAAAIVAAPLTAVSTLLYPMSSETRFALLVLTLSLLSFGIGEALNHPAHSGNTFTYDRGNRFNRFHQRYRSPCALGNLLLIFAIILFFICLARFFPF